MANEPDELSERECRVNAVIAAFLAAEDASEPFDREKWISFHADLRPELEAFFDDHRRLRGLPGPPRGNGRGAPVESTEPYDSPPGKAARVRPGTRVFDRYEVVAPLGSGGMGEVYRAWDPKLERHVAIKILAPGLADDAEHLRRFAQEARATGALKHPNILAIHDVVEHEGSPCIISELLEGKTLRATLAGTKLPPRRAVSYALQMAQGLAAAHARGIVHRDLKPENLFITQDGRLKILDFGLAKLTEPPDGRNLRDCARGSDNTLPGALLGTVPYMSPEQVCGKRVDHLSDIFTFGVILYEMLSGRRAFRRDSTAETMSAILKEDPPDLSEADDKIPAPLARIVSHCLEKTPEERFQSASDLAFALEALSNSSGTGADRKGLPPAPPRRRLRWTALAAAASLAASAAVAFLAGEHAAERLAAQKAAERVAERPAPVFDRLTHRNGVVESARFTPDATEILYGAAWGGKPVELFSTRRGSLQPQELGIAANILAIAPPAEMMVLLGPRHVSAHMPSGTLARGTLHAHALLPLMEDVQEADWFPNGGGRVVVRRWKGKHRLEHGETLLYKTDGWISHARVSPDGKEVAFLNHPVYEDDRGSVKVVNVVTGTVSRLSGEYNSAQGLAWSATGEEVWFTAAETTEARALYATTRSGRPRLVYRGPGWLTLQDIARDRHVLLTHSRVQSGIMWRRNDGTEERDLSWFDYSFSPRLSADGRTLVFTAGGQAGGPRYSIYHRGTDGTDAALLGEGYATGLSPKGRWVLSLLPTVPPQLWSLPTGSGEKWRVGEDGDGLTYLSAGWLSDGPDGQRILIQAREQGREPRLFVQDTREKGRPKPFTPEGVGIGPISPDGKRVAAAGPDGKKYLYFVDGGKPEPLPALAPEDELIGWSKDGLSLFVTRPGAIPAVVERFVLATQERVPFVRIEPTDPTGIVAITSIQVTPDGKSYAYRYFRVLSDLYLVEGLK
jgi:hypothetical protein